MEKKDVNTFWNKPEYSKYIFQNNFKTNYNVTRFVVTLLYLWKKVIIGISKSL